MLEGPALTEPRGWHVHSSPGRRSGASAAKGPALRYLAQYWGAKPDPSELIWALYTPTTHSDLPNVPHPLSAVTFYQFAGNQPTLKRRMRNGPALPGE